MLRLSKSYAAFLASCLVSVLNAQTDKSLPHHMNYNNFSVNLNYIYNVSAYRSELANTYLTGTYANYGGPDTVYYEKHRNIGASTLGFNLAYNKRISRRNSFSFGIGLNQKQQVAKYSVYHDRNTNKPDLKYTTVNDYAVFLNFSFNFYYRRFIFNAGNNFAHSIVKKSIYTYEDNSQRSEPNTTSPVTFYLQESVSYQLIQNKNLYLKISAEQSERFYWAYGYNNWFMLGGTYYF